MNPQLTRFLLLGAAASALTACATPQYAVRADGVAPPSPAPVTSPAIPPAAPSSGGALGPVVQAVPSAPTQPPAATGPISSQALPPPVAATRPPPASPPPPPPLPPPPPPPPPPPATVTRTVTVAGGQVVTVAGTPATYKVKSGDTLIGIADKLNMLTADLAKANNLKPPYRLRPGQTLKGKATSAKAYVVQSGDTLFSVAQRFNVTTASLASQNKIGASSTIRSGQRLTLPSNYRDSGPITRTEVVAVPAGSTPARTAAVTPPVTSTTTTTTTTATTASSIAPPPSPLMAPGRGIPSASTTTTTTTTTATAAAPLRGPAPSPQSPAGGGPVTDAVVQAAGAGRFEWPLRGEILAGFTPRSAPLTSGQRSDGLDIAAAAGTPVRAAAGGRVVYAGDLVGMGYTVLISNGPNLTTSYSNLGRIAVRINQDVNQGAEIGTVGTTGGVRQPQVHFEIRYQASSRDQFVAVDPLLLLPR